MPFLRSKICVLGDCRVGKTILLLHQAKLKPSVLTNPSIVTLSESIQQQKEFDYFPTSICDLFAAQITIPGGEPLTTVELNLFDCSGLSCHLPVLRSHLLKDSKYAILCFSFNDLNSFTNLNKWIQEVENELLNEVNSSSLHGIILGLRAESKESSDINQKMIDSLMNQNSNNFAYFEISTIQQIEGAMPDAPFNFLAQQIYEAAETQKGEE